LIDWCLTPTLSVFQLYHGVNKLYKLISITTSLEVQFANVLEYKCYDSMIRGEVYKGS